MYPWTELAWLACAEIFVRSLFNALSFRNETCSRAGLWTSSIARHQKDDYRSYYKAAVAADIGDAHTLSARLGRVDREKCVAGGAGLPVGLRVRAHSR
jgi:hypothetical protein